jgi:hypothetical protein
MEVDSAVALEPRPTELEITSSIGILSSIANGFGEVKGVAPIPLATLVKVVAHSNETSNLTF